MFDNVSTYYLLLWMQVSLPDLQVDHSACQVMQGDKERISKYYVQTGQGLAQQGLEQGEG
jgi:hypothetical protein